MAIRIGISYSYKKDNIDALATPNVKIIEMPIGPQLTHIPAPNPKIEPIIPVPAFFELFFNTQIWYVVMLATIEIKTDTIMIKTKLISWPSGMWNASMGSKNKNWPDDNRRIIKLEKIPIDIPINW